MACDRTETYWLCPTQDNDSCRGLYGVLEPMISNCAQRTIKNTIKMIYALTFAVSLRNIIRETGRFTNYFESIIAMVYDIRFDRAEGTVVYMQKD